MENILHKTVTLQQLLRASIATICTAPKKYLHFWAQKREVLKNSLSFWDAKMLRIFSAFIGLTENVGNHTENHTRAGLERAKRARGISAQKYYYIPSIACKTPSGFLVTISICILLCKARALGSYSLNRPTNSSGLYGRG